MTFFKTLKGRLTLGTGAVLAVVTMAILLLLQSLLGGLDKELIKAFKARAAANAKAISTDVAFEIATKAPKALKKKLTKFRKENRETHSIAVLGGDQSQLAKVGAGEINARFLQAMRDKDTARTVVQGELIIAMAPVIPEGEKKVVGYVIYTESLAAYHSKRKRTMTIGFSVIILLVLLALAGVYVIGHRTTKPFAMLVQTAQQIASGNLEDTTLDGGGALETQSLAGSITTMGLALRKQVLAIKALTNRVAAVAKEVSEAMSHLATAAVQQSSAVTETAATVEEMERNGHVAAENANQIAESAEQTSKTSIQGRDAVSTTGQIILRIQENSEDIRTKSQNLLTDVEEVGAIIGSVNAIAEQSKILAVNASIEAAKAGEYGAGFAVVAQEVKDLALQSKEATLQITQTLNAIRQAIDTMVNTAHAGASRTEEGVKTVANAGAIVNDLSEAINENSEFAKVIAANVKQQATGLTQIATAMTQINSASTESREVGSKIINETGQLTEAVEELATLVNQWTIPERGDADPVPSAQQQVA